MTADPKKIQDAVYKRVTDRLPNGVGAVSVDPAEDDEGEEYLLVKVQLSTVDVDDETLGKILEDIESEVAGLDERYPSVRFLDAA